MGRERIGLTPTCDAEAMPEPHEEAVRIVGLLADADRRAVVSALVLGASDVAGIRRASGLDARAIATAADRLVRGGLVEVDPETGTYILMEAAFSRAARRAAPAVAGEDHPEASDDEARVLRSFVRDGRLLSMPASHGKRQVVLDHIAQSFEPGVRYTEKQVNAILVSWYEDTATVRRYLVDGGFLSRESGEYWRTGGTFPIRPTR
jgi:hypothetical protein